MNYLLVNKLTVDYNKNSFNAIQVVDPHDLMGDLRFFISIGKEENNSYKKNYFKSI